MRLKDCEEQPIAEEFETIPFPYDMSYVDKISDSLCTDQKTLFDLCAAVSTGYVSPELAKRKLGKLSHTRWTTAASRVLRIYLSEVNPSETLRTVVRHILFVYVPSLFDIKHKSSMVFGSIHLANLLKSTRL